MIAQPRTDCAGSSVQSVDPFLLTPESIQCLSALTPPPPVIDTYPQPGRPAGRCQTHTTDSPVRSTNSDKDFSAASVPVCYMIVLHLDATKVNLKFMLPQHEQMK